MSVYINKAALLIYLALLPSILSTSFYTSFSIKDFSAQQISDSWYLFSVSFSGQFLIIDVTNPANPTLVSSIKTNAHPYRVTSNSKMTYILETTDPEQLVPLLDNYDYNNCILTIINTAQINLPSIVTSIPINESAHSLSTVSNLLFVSGEDYIHIFDTDYNTVNYSLSVPASPAELTSIYLNPSTIYLFSAHCGGILTVFLISKYPVYAQSVLVNTYDPYRDITVQNGILFAGTYKFYIIELVSIGVIFSGGNWTAFGNISTLNRFSVNFNSAHYICATFNNTKEILIFNDQSSSNSTLYSPVIMDTTFYIGGRYILGTVIGENMYVFDIYNSTDTSSSIISQNKNFIGLFIGIAITILCSF